MDSTKRMSGELFNILTTSLEGEPLQTLYNCNFNGLEAWRRLSKRYSPTTPLRAMQLMLQISRPEKTKDLEHVQTHIDRWESKILALGRDSDEQLFERMKAAVLVSTLPSELRDAILQNPDKFVTKKRVITMRRGRRGGTAGARKRRCALPQMRRTRAYRKKMWNS